MRIAEQIERDGNELRLNKAERLFAAHLTIGRVRSPRGRQELARALQAAAWRPPPSWRVESLTLYQSVLSSQGPRYTVLADIPLAMLAA